MTGTIPNMQYISLIIVCSVEPMTKSQRLSQQEPAGDMDLSGCELIPRVECPSIQSFLREYFSQSKPVIMTRCMEHWPALGKWSTKYIKVIITVSLNQPGIKMYNYRCFLYLIDFNVLAMKRAQLRAGSIIVSIDLIY